MSKGLHVEVLSPEGSICSLTATQVTLPTTSGEITVLPGHVPLFTRLAEGEIVIAADGGTTTYVGITGGFLELSRDTATILADYAVKSDSVVAARAEEAKHKAEEAMQKKDSAGFAMAEQDLKRSILELKISGRVKKRSGSQK
jgi:F-type H+-transporting ATPase subunit epsilon